MNICLLQILQWEEGSRSYPFPEYTLLLAAVSELKARSCATEKQQRQGTGRKKENWAKTMISE